MVLQNLWKTTLCGLWCSCAIERAVEGFALTDHDFGNLLPSLSLPFRFLWRGPFNKIGEGYFQYILEHAKVRFLCGGVKIYKLRHCEGLESWKQDPTWLRVVPGLVPCDHLVDLKVGLTDLVGLVVMVGLVTILKDCLESSHFRRQWASSVRQLVGTAHQQETSSEAARMWRCPAPFLSSPEHCMEEYTDTL